MKTRELKRGRSPFGTEGKGYYWRARLFESEVGLPVNNSPLCSQSVRLLNADSLRDELLKIRYSYHADTDLLYL